MSGDHADAIPSPWSPPQAGAGLEAAPVGRWRVIAIAALVGLAALAIIVYTILALMGSGGGHKSPPKITLIPSTPPPPPPPKEEKRPEPKEQKEDKVQAPQEQKIAPPDNPTLKMEGAAGDGPSAFSAGHVTSDDLSRLGNGGGNLVNPVNTYASTIKNELQRQLARNSELKRSLYKIEVRIWVGDDGRIRNFELIGTTSDADMDETIRQVLGHFAAFSAPPPPKMPQPIRLRLSSSGHA